MSKILLLPKLIGADAEGEELKACRERTNERTFRLVKQVAWMWEEQLVDHAGSWMVTRTYQDC